MSEKRSWDIQPKRRTAPAPAPVQQSQPVRRQEAARQRSVPTARREAPRVPQRNVLKAQPKPKPMPESQAQAIRRHPAVPQGKDRETLKARRRRARRRSAWAFSILIVVAVAGLFGSLWLPIVRIQSISTTGLDTDGMQTIARGVLSGTYHYIIPRNSIFFFSQDEIRADIVAQYPEISAVSIARTSLSTISIASIPREAALTWCGDSYIAQPVFSNASSTPLAPPCYSADAQGVIFAPITDPSVIADTLRIYGPLAGDGDSAESPLGAVIGQANLIPNALQFIKAIKQMGVPIVAFAIRGDEADLYAQSGTRITYVLGHEEVTAQVAESSFPSLNLNDGSLEYVDLRFEGKAYFKKVGSVQASAATSTSSGL